MWRGSLVCQERFKICKNISKWLKLDDVVSTIRHFSMYNFLSFLFTPLHILAFPESPFRCLQGPSKNIVPWTSRLISFKEKLTLLKYEKSNGNFDCFSSADKSYSIRKITKLLSIPTNFKPSLKPNFSRRIRIKLINTFLICKTQIWQQQKMTGSLIWVALSFTFNIFRKEFR